jgi:long-chain acyl-CoA synthetase
MTYTEDISHEPRPWFRSWPSHLPKHLAYPNIPAWWILERNLERFADKDAVLFLHHENRTELDRLTYRELWDRANALAAGLYDLGIRKGDRVGTLIPNSPAIITSYYGIWMAGAAITPCNALASKKEFTHQLQDAGAKILIAAENMADMAMSAAESLGIRVILAPVGETVAAIPADAVRFDDLIHTGRKRPADVVIDPRDDMAVLLYTGGTTGDPKGAALTHRNIVANTMQFAEWYALEPGKEVFVCTIPMSHSGGMSGVMNVPLYGGATLIVLRRFLAETVARVIEQYRATRFFGVPTMFVALLGSEKAKSCDMTSLKACRTNAAPLPVAVKKEFDRLIGREVLIEGYGLTETSPLTHANPIEKAKAGSIGIPLTDTDAKVIDLKTGADLFTGQEGELVLRGPQIMKGYWGKPEATETALAGGWFHTGDVVRMDEEGYFFIVDRVKDMINSGGYKVWPREVEEILYTHPKVRMAMVFGISDDYYGETVKACIVPKDEAKETITKDEITAFCKKKMASYKVPKHIEFHDSLPISAQGKMLRRLMKDETKC